MKNKSGLKKCIKYLGNAVSALSILFILWTLLRLDLAAVSVENWPVFLLICAAGVLLKTFTVCLSAGAWRRWLELLSGKRCSRREAFRVYAKANIGKYLPGNVMHYVGRGLFAAKLELSQKQIAAASVLEVAGLVLAAFCTSMLLAYQKVRKALELALAGDISARRLPDGSAGLWPAAVLAGAGIAAAVWAVFSFGLKKSRGGRQGIKTEKAAAAFSKRAGKDRRIAFLKTFAACFFTYAAVLVILGFIYVLLYWHWAGRPGLYQAALMTAAYIAAWALGFIIPGAPGGIGVREMVLTVLLVPSAGRELTAVLGIVHRLITVIGDFAAYLVTIPGLGAVHSNDSGRY